MTLEENPIYQQAQQMERLRALTDRQRAFVQWLVREQRMPFEDAHRLMLDRPAPGHSTLFRLVSINLPTPRPPRGRRLTRRQRGRR